MSNPSDIIKALIRTEKTTQYEPQGKYLFLVNNSANKIAIRRAVEQIYKVRVRDVNTAISIGKLKKVRYQLGRTPNVKKAIVTLKKGQKIEVS